MRARSLSLVTVAIISCGDDQPMMVSPDAADYTIGEAPQLAMPCTSTLADVYTLPTGLPAMDDSHRGDVFRCAVTEKLMVPEIRAQIEAYNTGYTNTTPGTITSGFWTYRIAYRTTRNTVGTARAEGDNVAVLLIPAKPLAGAPAVVFGHGSVGLAEKCAPSHLDLSTAAGGEDFPLSLYRLAGYGYTVIAPDYSGFQYGQSPGYFNAEDEAHAILDATRALGKLLPAPPDKLVFVGHSQGGHAVLAAHSYAKSYGMQGTLVGVGMFAPFWVSNSLWAAGTTDTAGLTTAKDTNSILYAMAYAYSAGELRDGPGGGLVVFQTDKQAGAKDFMVGGECYDTPKLQALGAKPSEFFTSEYVNTVGFTCAISPITPDCTSTIATMWKQRWIEDRPPIDPQGAPLLFVFGGTDTFITPRRAQCTRNKIATDLASGGTTKVQYCFNDVAGHRDVLRGPDADYMAEWIAARTGVGPEPAMCPSFPTDLTCQVPPHDY
jgi:dienelactone hydrolase